MKEKDLKLAVSQYLEYLTNQGKVYADRLNSGSVLVKRGEKTYRVELCREGTADFMVLKYEDWCVDCGGGCAIYFLELKGDKGKQRPEQGAFQKLIEAQGASYFLIRSIEEVIGILGE